MLVVDHQYAGLDSPYGPPLCSRATVGDMQEEEGAGGVVVNAHDDISDLDSVVEIQVDKTVSEAAEAKSNQISSASSSSSKKRRFHRPDLRTIRESPETIYTVSYIDMDEAAEAIEKEGINVPEPELATPGVTVLEIAQDTIEPPNEEGQENGCKITQSQLLYHSKANCTSLQYSRIFEESLWNLGNFALESCRNQRLLEQDASMKKDFLLLQRILSFWFIFAFIFALKQCDRLEDSKKKSFFFRCRSLLKYTRGLECFCLHFL